jgi:hypothetical protein
MKLPNFFLVGAMKSGTTSLYQYLNAHPQIYMSPVKEPNYFCKDWMPQPTERTRGMPADWNDYLRLFEAAGNQTAIGEASIVYLCSKCAAQEIHQVAPNSRILMLLRNPVERAYSQYLNEWKMNYQHASFREELERSRGPSELLGWVAPHPHIALGMYHDQVKRYLDRFGPDQVRVYLHDDLKRDAKSLVANVYGFLGVDPTFSTDSFEVQFNTTAEPRFMLFDKLVVEPLSRRVLTPTIRAKLHKGLRKVYYRGDPPPIEPGDRDFLKSAFRDDILKLQGLIDRDLSSWLR